MTIRGRNHEIVVCPDCGSRNLRYTTSTAVLDLVMFLFRKHALRCRDCRARFYEHTDEAANKVWVI
jgi:DNA-directed RNA polymerase subunit RPC12/RpoP